MSLGQFVLAKYHLFPSTEARHRRILEKAMQLQSSNIVFFKFDVNVIAGFL
jgi:hypothetical protein